MARGVRKAIADLKREYAVEAHAVEESPRRDEIILRVEGIDDVFHIWQCGDESILGTKAWHEHFDTGEGLRAFLTGLFTGEVSIVVKFRGKTPVGHSVQVFQDGQYKTVSWTGSLVSPFWRKKTYKTLDYRTPANPRIEPDATGAPKGREE